MVQIGDCFTFNICCIMVFNFGVRHFASPDYQEMCTWTLSAFTYSSACRYCPVAILMEHLILRWLTSL
jgi:hypothetical protein